MTSFFAWLSLILCCIMSHQLRNNLSFFLQVHPKDLNNGIINAAFMLLFKDLIKLFASYNDGIINLLGMRCFIETFITLRNFFSRSSLLVENQ